MFKGIKIVEKKHEIISPKTGLSYSVKHMDNSEEISLRSSIFAQKSSMELHINDIIWNCLTAKPKQIKNKNDFYNKTFESDRALLLYTIYLITYGKTERIEKFECEECKRKYPLDIDLTQIYHEKLAPIDKWDDFINKRIPVTHELIPGTKLILGDVTIKDVMDTADLTDSENNDLYFNYIKKIETKDLEDALLDVSTEDKYDIVGVYKRLPVSVKKEIEKTVKKEFQEYEPEFYFEHKCECGHNNKVYYNITQRFFRMVLRFEDDK